MLEMMLYFQTLLNNCVADVPDNYFGLLDAAGSSPKMLLNQIAKTIEREEVGSLSNFEHQKLQRMYTQGGAARRSVQNLVKAFRLPASKLRQSLHSKLSYTEIILTTSKLKRFKVFDRFRKKGVWLWHLSYFDNPAKVN